MKVMKLALLGTAALAAVSVSARADNLSDLKAQIEALNARVATLEATPSVPAGYSMISMSTGSQIVEPGYAGPKRDNYQGPVHVISIMPTADAPAPTTQITWTGYVRAAIVADSSPYTEDGTHYDDNTLDVKARAYLTVVGTTDTAVGEVGAKINLKADLGGGGEYGGFSSGYYNYAYGLFGGDEQFVTDGFSGWWKMTPNLTLEGGDGDSLSYNSHSFDALCNCFYGTDLHAGSVGNNPYSGATYNYWGVSTFDTKVAHLKLAYADGPISAAIQVEDGANYNSYPYNNNILGVSGQVAWSGDTFSLQATGGWWGNPYDYSTSYTDAYALTVGAGAKFGMFSIDASVGAQRGWNVYSESTIASAIIQANLSDSFLVQAGGTHVWYTNESDYVAGLNDNYTELDLGLYYTPVKQLTLGLEGAATFYDDPDHTYGAYEYGTVADTSWRAAFTSVFRF